MARKKYCHSVLFKKNVKFATMLCSLSVCIYNAKKLHILVLVTSIYVNSRGPNNYIAFNHITYMNKQGFPLSSQDV